LNSNKNKTNRVWSARLKINIKKNGQEKGGGQKNNGKEGRIKEKEEVSNSPRMGAITILQNF